MILELGGGRMTALEESRKIEYSARSSDRVKAVGLFSAAQVVCRGLWGIAETHMGGLESADLQSTSRRWEGLTKAKHAGEFKC